MQKETLTSLCRPLYENGDPSHDFAHVLRVKKMCEFIGTEERANLELLIPAALLHDVVNVPKNSPDRSKASEMAAIKAKELLLKSKYSEHNIQMICTIIKEHSYSLGQSPSSIESAILQDADRLDGLGAIGIMRTVTCGCLMGAKYYHEVEPFAELQGPASPREYRLRQRELDDKSYTIDHFYRKLLKLAAGMNTETARVEALKRTKFMQEFLSQLSTEVLV